MTSKHHHSLFSKVFGTQRKKTKNKGDDIEINHSHDEISLSNISIQRSPEAPVTPQFSERRARSGSIFDSLRKFFPDDHDASKSKVKSRPKISAVFHENEALTKIIPVDKPPFDENEYICYINGLPVNVYTANRRKIIKKRPTNENIANENENETKVVFINGMPVNVYTDRVKKVVKKTPPPLSRDQNNNRSNNRLSMKSSIIYRQSVANFDYIEKAKEIFIKETVNTNEATTSLNESIEENSSGSPSSNRSRTSFVRKRINSSSRSNSNLGGLLSSTRIISRDSSPFPLDKLEKDDDNILKNETDEQKENSIPKDPLSNERVENINEIIENIEKQFEEIDKIADDYDKEKKNEESLKDTRTNAQEDVTKNEIFKETENLLNNNTKEKNHIEMLNDSKTQEEGEIFKEIEHNLETTNQFEENRSQQKTNEDYLSKEQDCENEIENDILKEIEKDLEETNQSNENDHPGICQEIPDEDEDYGILDDSGSSNLYNRLTSHPSSSSADLESCKTKLESPPEPLAEEQNYIKESDIASQRKKESDINDELESKMSEDSLESPTILNKLDDKLEFDKFDLPLFNEDMKNVEKNFLDDNEELLLSNDEINLNDEFNQLDLISGDKIEDSFQQLSSNMNELANINLMDIFIHITLSSAQILLLQSDIYIEDFPEDYVEDGDQNFQLRYVRVYFHVYGEENTDLNESDNFFKHLKSSKTDFMAKIRHEIFKTDIQNKKVNKNEGKNLLKNLKIFKLYNHIIGIENTTPIDEKTFFNFLSKAKSEMGNDCREVYYSFIEQYEIFNRIYDEFNDEEGEYQERSSNNNDLEEIQEEEEEEESEYHEGSSSYNGLEEIQEEEEESIDKNRYLDSEDEKRMDELIKLKLIKKLEFLKDSIYKQKNENLSNYAIQKDMLEKKELAKHVETCTRVLLNDLWDLRCSEKYEHKLFLNDILIVGNIKKTNSLVKQIAATFEDYFLLVIDFSNLYDKEKKRDSREHLLQKEIKNSRIVIFCMTEEYEDQTMYRDLKLAYESNFFVLPIICEEDFLPTEDRIWEYERETIANFFNPQRPNFIVKSLIGENVQQRNSQQLNILFFQVIYFLDQYLKTK